jgi:flagellar L-ring protein precursor FlgH
MAVAALALASSAAAQELIPTGAIGRPPAEAYYDWSLIAVRPPEPTTYQKHDLITIIINENSRQSAEQQVELEKEYQRSARLEAIIDLWQVLETRLEPGLVSPIELLDFQADTEFEGDGSYERADRVTDRVTAEVIDVKPNGVLVLEAKRVVQMDDEEKIVVLSGMCDTSAVTAEKTVQSNQLANLTLTIKHEGELKNTTEKGWISRVLDSVFAF